MTEAPSMNISVYKKARTVLEDTIADLNALCFAFKCLVDVSLDSDFSSVTPKDFSNWIGFLSLIYENVNKQVSSLDSCLDMFFEAARTNQQHDN